MIGIRRERFVADAHIVVQAEIEGLGPWWRLLGTSDGNHLQLHAPSIRPPTFLPTQPMEREL